MSKDVDDLRAKYELLGVFITVLSLLIASIYSEGAYDYWDILIGAVGVVFAYGYLTEVRPSKWLEIALPAIIFSLSLKISASAVVSVIWYGAGNRPSEAHDLLYNDGNSIFLVLMGSLGVAVLARMFRRQSA